LHFAIHNPPSTNHAMTIIRAALLIALTATTSVFAKTDWGRFRGPNGSGVAETTGLPTAIDEASTVWKVALGKGWSSPVLWKDMVIVTAETGEGKRAVIALSAKDGKQLWKYEVPYVEHRKHDFNSFASTSPFVDEIGIYVNWSSGTDIQALAVDHMGKLLWKNDHVADYIHEHGTGMSPIVEDGIMIVRSEFDWKKGDQDLTRDATHMSQPEQKAWKSCIVGLNAKTGKQVWKTDMPNNLNTFSTPVVRELPGGKKEFVCADTGSGVIGIDTKTGKMNWQHNPGYKQRSLGSAAFAGGIYFTTFGSGGGGKETAALDLTGDKPKVLDFGIIKGLPYVPTPLVVGDLMYLLGDGGILQCVEFKTGKVIYEERLNGSAGSSKFFSSPVAGDGKIYCGSQQGDVIVDSPINATSAIGDGRIYIRTEKMLWCAGSKAAPVP
jgi:outer membrane protein assembly factor BamB